MLSKDELLDGITVILKLRDPAGEPIFWMQKLRGEVAAHWRSIYQTSDWQALRNEALTVFGVPVAASDAKRTFRSQRCLVIAAMAVCSRELVAAPAVC
jgi:hypothetical protein